ncbi:MULTISPECIES: TlyA family RNA methyltransferase [unclassified Actinomyces]|uniref:TlyA family RNA methyltransferase n=1 Tax=unclassified Actinomyces TaxID=2609248 RepID=UPI0013A6EC96|nr:MULTISPECIES: TlyA family RNA methyltransferase [unclassified Actinomyces]MBW3069608.1 TlyA family RNA methyltransferase [Actinomyces sp. 594]NDR53215.1 TlyA family RNA methyltransferase [Actinomyces sp. 565]
MARLIRIDSELVRRGLAHSRAHAARLIADGRVSVDGVPVLKPARQVNPAQAIEVTAPDGDDYVSRGAYKLAGALDSLAERGLAPPIAGRRCLDAGASTGGFTDVLLRRGAAHVVAVDVGYGQLAWSLRNDPRVTVLERTNVRTLDPGAVAPAPALVVGDLSFISLTTVLPALVAAAAPDADLLLMVKPQFEVGRQRLGHGGVVRDPDLHIESVLNVCSCAHRLGLGIDAVTASPLPGPAGNVEYFVNMHAGQADSSADLAGAALRHEVRQAVAAGPAGRSSDRSRRTEGGEHEDPSHPRDDR